MSVVVGMVLIVLAGAELVSGIIDFFSDVKKTSFDSAVLVTFRHGYLLRLREPPGELVHRTRHSKCNRLQTR